MSTNLIFSFFLIQGRSMKASFLALLFLLPLPVLADRVGNGGDIAEKNVRLALAKYTTVLNYCLSQANCLPRSEDQNALKKLLADFPLEHAEKQEQLQFLSGAKHPEVFGHGPDADVWSTEPRVGEKIYINTDKINLKVGDQDQPITVRQAFRIVFVALGTHHESLDLIYLDQLAFRIVEMWPSALLDTMMKQVSGFREMLSSEEWIKMYAGAMPDFLALCLADVSCTSETGDQNLLQAILRNASSEPKVEKLIHFDSGRKNPELFTVDGVMKSAVTGLRVGDPIYFNLDKLYTMIDGKISPIASESLFALLLHELGHHTGTTDHAKLDLLSSQVADFLSVHAPVGRFNEDDDVAYFHKPAHFVVQLLQGTVAMSHLGSRTKILLSDEVKFFEFSSFLEKKLNCPTGQVIKSYAVNEAHWTGRVRGSKEFRWISYRYKGIEKHEHLQLQTYGFAADVSLLCRSANGRDKLVRWQNEIELTYSFVLTASESEGFANRQYIFDRVE